jgi:putative spermidine/putrescine transport system ATP-binding protein
MQTEASDLKLDTSDRDRVQDHDDFLVFDQVKKTYDQKTMVVKDFSLSVKKGEFVTLLGPSGSGKTTVLMMLAGFESVTSGNINLQAQSITRTPPYKRNIGMVFQSYALFPHMTIAENLAYPLKLRKLPQDAVKRKVSDSLAMIEMREFGGRYPAQLSGGQRQRVALARALIFEPDLVLMDEPLGALDKKLREQMQYEITRLHKELGFTVIYVTHDQTEALTMSSRIAVFNHGVVQQCSTPAELYERPKNAFVAGFIGENNFIDGVVLSQTDGRCTVQVVDGEQVHCNASEGLRQTAACRLSIRPEKLFIEALQGGRSDADKSYVGATFITGHYVGDFIRNYFRLANGNEINVKILNDADAPQLQEGERATLSWFNRDCTAFPD